MSRISATILAGVAVIALAGPSGAAEPGYTCPPDAPGNMCVPDSPEPCGEANNFCQPLDYATLAAQNAELRHRVEVLEYEAALLNARIQFKILRIRLLRERLHAR